ncbi:integrin alpha-L isoform X3 [Hemicordylus capensis]|uniref:integrin alpha-L isoform X3 n=1 Tax=Hemicordylus capensis TaxID=884348 RepID=UPI00230254FC|nr:integrin alpha-L isoform X3 [Hemicordylus capensis]
MCGGCFCYFGFPIWVRLTSRIVVGAPGEQNSTGKIYQCSMQSKECQDVPLEGSSGVSHLGMTLARNAQGSQMIACGPGVAQHCDKNLYVSGICYLLDAKLSNPQNITTGYEKCLKGNLDLVFLFDGSESMTNAQFNTTLSFMIDVMEQLRNSTIHFAAVQFSQSTTTAFDFNAYIRDPNPRKLLANVQHEKSITNTYKAIKFVVDTIFTPECGMRPQANKAIIIITDGQATDIDTGGISAAKNKAITRFIIGIGQKFKKSESEVFASTPKEQFVKHLDTFEQLKTSFTDLQSKIYAIEGVTADGNGTSDSGSFHLELSSSGFSADISQGRVVLGAVGADNWAGGLLEPQNDFISERFITAPLAKKDMVAAYLGYAVKFLKHNQKEFYAAGAPRYQHVGRVFIFEVNLTTTNWTLTQEIEGPQIGSYFGAVLCPVDVDNDGETDLLLIGAHLYFTEARGGLVYVYGWGQNGLVHQGELQGDTGYRLGRFGMAIADLTDINGDGRTDVAVGAPLEDEENGVIYIYNGHGRTLNMHYSQRIKGANVSPGLKFFGQSIYGKTDLSGDQLTDIAVGALGNAVVLRSRPVITVAAAVKFQPQEIPVKNVECLGDASSWKTASVNLSICFNTTLATYHYQGPISARLSFHLEIDQFKMKNRGVFRNGEKVTHGVLEIISLKEVCIPENILFQNCLEDYIKPIEVFVNFSLEDGHEPNNGNPRPVLNSQSSNTTQAIHFQKNCGTDEVCNADMKIVFHSSGSKELLVLPGKEVNVSLQLKNNGENAYYVTLHVPHIPGLSFRKASVLKSTTQTIVNCDGMQQGQDSKDLLCNISHPVYRENAEALIQLQFSILDNNAWGNEVKIVVNVSSENEEDITSLSDNNAADSIPVRYPVNIIVRSLDTSIQRVDFSSLDQGNKTVTHLYEVINKPMGAFPSPEMTVFVMVPSVLPSGLIWKVDTVQSDHAVSCQPLQNNTKSTRASDGIKNHSHQIEKCEVKNFLIYQCNLGQNNSGINVTGVLHATKEIECYSSSKLCTALWLEFDDKRYKQYYNIALESQVTTEVEMIFVMNYLPVIIGSATGGFLLLIIIIAGLYKCGFFKRNYKDKLDTEEETMSALQEDKPEGNTEGDKEIETKSLTDQTNGEVESK